MRAALYFAPPPESELSLAAMRWLGRDAWRGIAIPRGAVNGLPEDEVDRFTAEPRRYGFHATLKPPFRISVSADLADLRSQVVGFGTRTGRVVLPAIRLERIGSFFALTPASEVPALRTLADDVVRAFEPFRAPLTEAEIARRRPERLTERQCHYLRTWGYPYVFDEFRFHMTLTGAVPEDHQGAVERALRERFAPFLGRPLAMDRLCLFIEPSPPGDFIVDSAAGLR